MDPLMDAAERIRRLPEALLPMRERLLANLVMIAQIPAPTGDEERPGAVPARPLRRGRADATPRPTRSATPWAGSAARRGNRTILLVSHLDTIFPANQDHDVIGQGRSRHRPRRGRQRRWARPSSRIVPAVLEHLGIELNSDLILLGSIRSLGRGNHAGIRFFLDHLPRRRRLRRSASRGCSSGG